MEQHWQFCILSDEGVYKMSNQKNSMEGKYYNWSSKIAAYFVTELCFLLSIVPSSVVSLFLIRDFSNITLYILFNIPVIFGLSAMFSNVIAIQQGNYLMPFMNYWKNYIRNLKDAVRIAFIFAGVALVCLVDIEYFMKSDFQFMALFFVFLLFVGTVLTLFVLAFSAKYSFRIRDLFRLAAFYALSALDVTGKLVSYLVVVGAFYIWISPSAWALTCIFVAVFFVKDLKLILADIEDKYIKEKELT